MSRIVVGQENATPIELYYEDHGSGSPVVLIHGWPLSGASWEKQVGALLAAGHRVVTYDRRGFGQSSKPSVGYDYDTFAGDLHKLIVKLDLRNCALVGFSMGGGEVARYLGTHGSERVSRAIFISAITPCLLQGPDNPDGIAGANLKATRLEVSLDRPRFLTGFLENFFNLDQTGGKRVSDEVMRYCWNVGVSASPKGTLDSVSAWSTDFRRDVSRIDIPTMVIHGDADRILPAASTAIPLSKLLQGSRLVLIAGAPHGLTWTHSEQVNAELVAFLALRTTVSVV